MLKIYIVPNVNNKKQRKKKDLSHRGGDWLHINQQMVGDMGVAPGTTCP